MIPVSVLLIAQITHTPITLRESAWHFVPQAQKPMVIVQPGPALPSVRLIKWPIPIIPHNFAFMIVHQHLTTMLITSPKDVFITALMNFTQIQQQENVYKPAHKHITDTTPQWDAFKIVSQENLLIICWISVWPSAQLIQSITAIRTLTFAFRSALLQTIAMVIL